MNQQDKLSFLKQKFLSEAAVKDSQKGYIVVKSFNLAIDPDILEISSRAWAEHYHRVQDIDAIVGLPDAGSRLVSVLANMLRIPKILPSKRANTYPGSWVDLVSYSNKSFTTDQEDIKSYIGFIKKSERVLIVDDVIAYGETAIAAIKAFQTAGVEVVGMAVLFDKLWQGGTQAVFDQTGIKPFSLITIKQIDKNNNIILED